AHRHGDVFARLKLDDRLLLFLILSIRQLDQGEERTCERDRYAAIFCRDFRFAQKIAQRLAYLLRRQVGRLPHIRSPIWTERELAVRLEYRFAAGSPELDDFQRRGADVDAKYAAFFFFSKKRIPERHIWK